VDRRTSPSLVGSRKKGLSSFDLGVADDGTEGWLALTTSRLGNVLAVLLAVTVARRRRPQQWSTVRRYARFDGTYVPPLTEVEIEVPFSGSF